MSEIYPVKGIKLATAAAGIKYPDRNDVLLIEIAHNATTAAVFTRNAFCAAPVTIARQHLSQSSPRYLLVNSGNANAGTGDPGYQAAMASCQHIASEADSEISAVLPFSTGVIGVLLDDSKIAAVSSSLVEALDENNWLAAASAIMTTDTVEKIVSVKKQINGRDITFTGICKGSGMIRPDMATMLAYVATDATVDKTLLQQALHEAVEPSFNAITVDGDTSTNDACVLMASGQGDVAIHDADDDFQAFCALLTDVCSELARKIVLDGEGATKLITIQVEHAGSIQEAREVAFTVAHSPLVKTAMFASDPNWGRILAAVGRSGVENFVIDKVEIYLGDVCIVEQGGVSPGYTEAAGQVVMDQDEIIVRIVLNRGQYTAKVLTCDFSYDYVKINAEYRT